MEDVTTEMCKTLVQQLPQILQDLLQRSCKLDLLSGDKVWLRSAVAVISKLNLPILSFVLPVFVKDAGLMAAVMLVDIAMQTLPQSPELQSWHDTLHTAAQQEQADIAFIQSALQPYVPTDPSSMVDDAIVDFCWRGTLEKVNKMLVQKTCLNAAATLARRGCMKVIDLDDLLGGLADLKVADQISPIQDCHQLMLLGQHLGVVYKKEDTAYSVQIFDRMLCLKPATHPARKAYEKVFQQQGACKGTLGQYKEAFEDLRMAMKLGDGDEDNAVMTLYHISYEFEETGNIKVALTAMEAAFENDPIFTFQQILCSLRMGP